MHTGPASLYSTWKTQERAFNKQSSPSWARQLRKLETIGQGAYGIVYKVEDVTSGQIYAVKVLDKRGQTPQQLDYLYRETYLHQKVVGHSNVVAIHDVAQTADEIYILMEYCEDGDLFTSITEKGLYVGREEFVRSTFLQILSAIEHCHQRGVYHRDLKPENILLRDGGRSIKLADFGLATSNQFNYDVGCGSTFYMSPECYHPEATHQGCYSSAANDVWSLGIILVNLVCGRNPWKKASTSDASYKAYIKNRHFLSTILDISPELSDILCQILEPDWKRRVTLPRLRQMILHCRAFTKAAAEKLAATPAPAVYTTPFSWYPNHGFVQPNMAVQPYWSGNGYAYVPSTVEFVPREPSSLSEPSLSAGSGSASGSDYDATLGDHDQSVSPSPALRDDALYEPLPDNLYNLHIDANTNYSKTILPSQNMTSYDYAFPQ